MIPDSTLYDDYIDRPKLSEQKNHLNILFLPLQEGSKQQEHSQRELMISNAS